MKYNFLLLLTLFFVFVSYGQDIRMCGYQGYQTVEEVNSACDLQNAEQSDNDTEDAEQVVDGILDKVGLFRNFLIEECDNINNALAVTMPLDGGDIDRYILYDIEFFKKVTSSTGTDWGLTSILAHEVGHHLNGHTLKSGGSNHKIELQADEFSGFVLARMKCSLEDAQIAVSNLLPDEASSTHPAKQDRLDAIAKGWSRGNGNTIVVKKIEEVNDEKEITSEMVLVNYIDALGGQENIRKVKSLYMQTEADHFKEDGSLDRKSKEKITYISPLEFINVMDNKKDLSESTMYLLSSKVGTYYKMKESDSWILSGRHGKNDVSSQVSWVQEYSYLVNGTNLDFDGIVNKNGQEFYKIILPKVVQEITNETIKLIFSSTYINFYSVKTGLLVIQEETIVNKTDYIVETGGLKDTVVRGKHEKTYSDYKEINGVFFPFKISGHINFEQVPPSNYTKIFTKIEVNPEINKDDFDITK